MADQSKEELVLSYENALARLEEVVRNLEKGEATLDQSLQLFQEGIVLVRHCHGKLDEYEAKVQKLIEAPENLELFSAEE
ncbi:exodeoxyribonuclease VII small subunit [Heliorestis acidaminivorans]|uniref:Exodeoxyribonuclease 7 small subunit n=1 Tax=Heliorestis acidaminivorans TaxID=553427 RepID=A0A6I0F090_9FIRM|nr:exodeoxyribonuclease VII small subunit [Heliorestis acidaminivorans]KAB2951684.1 exodeoxyribonuclease VII small subunit [Heliorestis acidaminivorans]